MTWYYASGGQQLGPVDEAALDDLIRQGVVRDDTLVWKAGMSGWQPLGAARPRAASPVAPPAPAPAPNPYPNPAPQPAPAAAIDTRYCSECGRPYPANQLYAVGAATVCTACYPAFMQRSGGMAAPQGMPGQQMGAPQMQMAGPMGGMPGGWHYGGFWIRFLARVIDGILVGIVSTIIRLPLALLMGGGTALTLGRADRDPAAALAAIPMLAGAIGIGFVIQIALSLGYEVYFLSTRGATVGKMALGLRVIRADGGPISAGLAAGRYFASILSTLTIFIGYIIAGFDPEKRSLHDRICNTRVIHTR